VALRQVTCLPPPEPLAAIARDQDIDDVANKINTTVGKRVALHYEQHLWIPFSCFGDTGYFVTDVRDTE